MIEDDAFRSDLVSKAYLVLRKAHLDDTGGVGDGVVGILVVGSPPREVGRILPMRRGGRDVRQRGLLLGRSKQPAAHGWACDQRQREAGEVFRASWCSLSLSLSPRKLLQAWDAKWTVNRQAWVDWYIYTDHRCVYIFYVLGVKMSEGVEVREQRSLIFQMFKKYKSSSVYIHRLLGCQ